MRRLPTSRTAATVVRGRPPQPVVADLDRPAGGTSLGAQHPPIDHYSDISRRWPDWR